MFKKVVFAILCVAAVLEAIFLLRNKPHFCQKDTDCPKFQKCQNALCFRVGCLEEGETPDSGGISPEYSGHKAKNCCAGYKQITFPNEYDKECNWGPVPGSPGFYCSKKCGNQVCDHLETKCNCPQDCN